MRTIDVHTHAFPDAIAAAASQVLERRWSAAPSFDGTLAGLVRAMDDASIDVAVVQPVATKPQQVRTINDWLASVANDRVATFGAMHPDVDDVRGEISHLVTLGFRGFKLHPELQTFHPDSDRMRPVYEAAIANNLAVFSCAGVNVGVPTLHSTPQRFAAVLDEYPSLRLILAHMGGYLQWDNVRRDLVGREVSLDTSYSLLPLGGLERDEFVEIVREHGADRVLFGTDAPLADMSTEIRAIVECAFEATELEAIMWRNAARLLGRQPSSSRKREPVARRRHP